MYENIAYQPCTASEVAFSLSSTLPALSLFSLPSPSTMVSFCPLSPPSSHPPLPLLHSPGGAFSSDPHLFCDCDACQADWEDLSLDDFIGSDSDPDDDFYYDDR